MELKTFFAQDLLGNVIPNPTVYVYQPGTTTLATGLENETGGALTNPFTGNVNGKISVAAPDGDYDLRVVGAGRDSTMRVRFIDSSDNSGNVLRQDLASTAAGKGVALVAGAAKESDMTIVQKFEPIDSRLIQSLLAAQRDLFVLLQSDSTGNEDSEWFRVMIGLIAARFPTHTFRYLLWDHDAAAWGTASTVRTGSGGRSITFYNGAYPGATFAYWCGNRNAFAYDGKEFDLIISSYGLNVGDEWRTQAERLAEYLYTLRVQQPKAEVVVTIQPPDYNLPVRSDNRASAQRWVCEQVGVRVVDVYSIMRKLVAQAGGDYSYYYVDGVHPNAAFHQIWAQEALREIQWQRPGSAAGVSPKADLQPNGVPNGNFTSWLAGTSSPPTFWKTTTSCIRNTIAFETGGMSARCLGGGSGTGLFYIDADDLIAKYQHGGDIWVAARVRSLGGSGKAGTLYFAHSVTGARVEIQSRPGHVYEVENAFIWTFMLIPRSMFAGFSNFHLGFFSGETGEQVNVDRMVIGNSMMIADTNMSTAWERKYSYNDSGFSIPGGETVLRTFGGAGIFCEPGCDIRVNVIGVPAGVVVSARSFASNSITLALSNNTASAVTVPAYTAEFTVSAN